MMFIVNFSFEKVAVNYLLYDTFRHNYSNPNQRGVGVWLGGEPYNLDVSASNSAFVGHWRVGGLFDR